MTSPRVTVFIPVYNAGPYLREAINSILAQTWSDLELLLVNDGSTDDSAQVLAEFEFDARVTVLTHTPNQGGPATRNQGFTHARGEYLALMDADDFAMPNRLASQVAFLDARPDVDVLGCGWTFLNEFTDRSMSERGRYRLEYTPEEIAAELLFHCAVHQSTVMMRRCVYHAFRYDPAFPVAQDYDLWSRVMIKHKFAILPQPLMFYRKHEGQITNRRDVDERSGRVRVQAKQLDALGMKYSTEDLELHNAIFQFTGIKNFEASTGKELNLDTLLRLRDWIQKLVQANRRHRIYPHREHSRILSDRWFRVCRKAARRESVGAVAWLEWICVDEWRDLFLTWLTRR